MNGDSLYFKRVQVVVALKDQRSEFVSGDALRHAWPLADAAFFAEQLSLQHTTSPLWSSTVNSICFILFRHVSVRE